MGDLFVVAIIAFILLACSVAFVFSRKKKDSTERVKRFLNLIKDTQAQLEIISGGEYLNNAKVKRWLSSNESKALRDFDHLSISPFLADRRLFKIYKDAKRSSPTRTVNNIVKQINEKFVQGRLLESKKMFDALGLTESQRLAVVRDEDANLINAGAGSGKTRTILGKIKYLIERKLAEPSEILIVVYNRKIKEEIEEKLVESALEAKVATFHSLGREIVQKSENDRLVISNFAEDENKLAQFLIEKMKDLFNLDAPLNLITKFFTAPRFEKDPEKEVKTQDEYFSKVGLAGLRSLDGTKLKSQQEVQIANWFVLNGIAWEYEKIYPHSESGQVYRPDFYLPDYDLWIEHFGIDEDGNTAPWIPKEKYNSDIEWKRSMHERGKTNFVETYSYEARKDGGLQKALEEKLSEYNVERKPPSEKDINNLVKDKFQPIPDFIRLIMRFLSLSRENELDKHKLARSAVSFRDRMFLEIFNFFRDFYENELQVKDEIDFTDMVVRGMEYIKNGRYKHSYKYILVDEYQDITKVRLEFLLALQNQVEDARLFCVGDDWQSIYQFQGANVSLIKDFEKYVDAMQRTDLGRTFRYPQKVSDFSGIFITQNPAQLKKEIVSSIPSGDEDRPIKIIYYESIEYEKALNEVVDDIVSQSGGLKQKCFVLGRYNHNKPYCWRQIARYAASHRVDMEFSTIHKSKGRESDWVVIIENKSDLYGSGFPSEIQDDPVLKMVMPDEENYPNAEERRLFYVAVTRTRRGVFLLVPDGKASTFIKEICPPENERKMSDTGKSVYEPFVEIKGSMVSNMVCPDCEGQTIERKEFGNDGRFFYGCSHFPACSGILPVCKNESCNAPINLKAADCGNFYLCSCGIDYQICPLCKKGILEKRTGSRGEFFGCSRYGVANCKYTRDINQN